MGLAARVKRWWLPAFALAYVALGLGLSLRFSPLGDLGVEADFFAELAPAAQALAGGHLAVANYPFKGPLYSFALVPVHAVLTPLGVGWYRAAVVLSLVAAALTLLVVHRLARRLAGPRVAAVVTVITAATKVFFIHAQKAASDPLFVLLALGAVALLLAGPPRRRTWLLAGAVAGLAWLTRESGIVVPVWATVALLLVDPDRLPWRRRALAAACVWAGFTLAALPWLAVCRAQTGHWLVSHNLQNVVDEFYVGERAAAIPPGGFRSLPDLVAHDPGWFTGHFLANLPRHFVGDLHEIPGLTFGAVALCGLALLAWRRPDRRQVAFLLFAVLVFLSLGAVFHRPRFGLVLVPAWALLVALGGERLPRWRGPATWAVVAFLVALHAGHSRDSLRFYDRQQPRHLLGAIAAAPQWAHLNQDQGHARRPVLMARKGHLAHYAGLAYLPYPAVAKDPADLVARARARGADFLAVGQLERQPLADPASLDHLERLPGVREAWRDDQTIVYRLLPVPPAGD